MEHLWFKVENTLEFNVQRWKVFLRRPLNNRTWIILTKDCRHFMEMILLKIIYVSQSGTFQFLNKFFYRDTIRRVWRARNLLPKNENQHIFYRKICWFLIFQKWPFLVDFLTLKCRVQDCSSFCFLLLKIKLSFFAFIRWCF